MPYKHTKAVPFTYFCVPPLPKALYFSLKHLSQELNLTFWQCVLLAIHALEHAFKTNLEGTKVMALQIKERHPSGPKGKAPDGGGDSHEGVA